MVVVVVAAVVVVVGVRVVAVGVDVAAVVVAAVVVAVEVVVAGRNPPHLQTPYHGYWALLKTSLHGVKKAGGLERAQPHPFANLSFANKLPV